MNNPENKILEMTFQLNKDRNGAFISNHKLISDKLFNYRQKFGGKFLDHKFGRNMFQTYLIKNKLKCFQFKIYFNLNNIKSEDYLQDFYYDIIFSCYISKDSDERFYNIKKIIKKYIRLLKMVDIENFVE